jgi:hypothetical protein
MVIVVKVFVGFCLCSRTAVRRLTMMMALPLLL